MYTHMQVTFTRCLYAKLLHQRFNPPPRSGFELAPPTSHAHKAHDLGVKLVSVSTMLVCVINDVCVCVLDMWDGVSDV